MTDEISKTITYLAVLAAFLIAVSYWAGLNNLLKTTFSGVNTLDLTATGRTSTGTFAGYPANSPTG